MSTPPSTSTGADFTNQFISDRYTSLIHLSGNNLTEDFDGVYDGKGNYTGIEISTSDVSIHNVTMLKSATDTTLLDMIYPINSIFLSIENVNPGTRFIGSEWELVSEGLFLAGIGTGTDKNGNTQTIDGENVNQAGEYSHTLTEEELASHRHQIFARSLNTGQTNTADRRRAGFEDQKVESRTRDGFIAETNDVGESQPHNNTPPSYGVYVWKRIS